MNGKESCLDPPHPVRLFGGEGEERTIDQGREVDGGTEGRAAAQPSHGRTN